MPAGAASNKADRRAEAEASIQSAALLAENQIQARASREKRIGAIGLILMIVGLVAGELLVSYDPNLGDNWVNYLIFGVGGLFLGAVIMIATIAVMGYEKQSVMATQEREAIHAETSELKVRIDEDFFNSLVKINFRYIDQYYLQTRVQANKSFLAAVLAAIAGLGVTLMGIVMMYNGLVEPGYVSTGAGLISQFIAAVFFYLYNKTVIAMAGYHRKLVLTQNVGLALRITQDLPEDKKAEARMQLIERLSTDINALIASDGSAD
jgi:MFS family permease